MKKQNRKETIIQTLKTKAVMKQDVYKQTAFVFSELKAVIREIVAELKKEMDQTDKRIVIDFKERSEFQVELKVAGDVLFFHMHTNIFEFDKSHPVWKTSYVKDNEFNSYCGMIQVYNFLADSFKYNRVNDVGYMVTRIFINRESHFFVEGKRQLGFLYNDFVTAPIDREALKAIVESTILYCLNFDLFTPPFDSVREVTVSEIQEASNSLQIKTGKRLGFRFLADTDQIE